MSSATGSAVCRGDLAWWQYTAAVGVRLPRQRRRMHADYHARACTHAQHGPSGNRESERFVVCRKRGSAYPVPRKRTNDWWVPTCTAGRVAVHTRCLCARTYRLPCSRRMGFGVAHMALTATRKATMGASWTICTLNTVLNLSTHIRQQNTQSPQAHTRTRREQASGTNRCGAGCGLSLLAHHSATSSPRRPPPASVRSPATLLRAAAAAHACAVPAAARCLTSAPAVQRGTSHSPGRTPLRLALGGAS